MIRLARTFVVALKLSGMLMFASFLCWTPRAFAAATNCTSGGGALTLPPVTVPSNPAVGTLLGTPTSTTVTFTCNNLPYSAPSAPNNYSLTATIQAGLLALADATNTPGSGGIIFATNLSGIALKLTATPVQASDKIDIRGGPGSTRGFEPGSVTAPTSAWKCIQYNWLGYCSEMGGTYTGSVSETFTAQLIVTGPVTPGTLNSVNLMQFNWYIYGIGPSQGYFASLKLNSSIVSAPACSVVNFDTPVQLPTIFSSALKGTDTYSDQPTPFSVKLICQSQMKLAITLDATSKTGKPGVITNVTGPGYAGNVGVQILKSNGDPVLFGSAIDEGTTPIGTMNLPFSARYYQTGAPITGGKVWATATYTLTYP
ncbi:type 1 fimbria pilin [Rhodanobacter sp. TND4EL1]